MPTNNPVVDRQPPENNNTETENNNSPPIVPDDSDAQHVKTCRLKAAGPAKPIHDVFIGGFDYNTTEDEVRACLMDFNIENIRKVEKLETSGSKNSPSVHVIINDISIKESVYGNDMFPPGVIVIPYRYYKSHTSYNYKTSPSTRQSSSILTLQSTNPIKTMSHMVHNIITHRKMGIIITIKYQIKTVPNNTATSNNIIPHLQYVPIYSMEQYNKIT